jgi:hypothetical protein
VVRTTLLTITAFVLTAPVALASEGHDGGEGLWGETNDEVITNGAFIIIAAIPTFVLIMSLIQWRLDKRKERRLAAAKARKARTDLRGGW